MAWPWLLIVLGLGLLVAGAEALVRGSASLARRLGVSPLVVGLTVVAYGTSAPELLVSLQAAASGRGSIAIGNVVGSNIANIALILGLAALISPLTVRAKVIRIDLPILLVSTGILIAFLLDQRVGRIEGAVLFLGALAYTAFTLVAARRESLEVVEEFAAGVPSQRGRVIWDVLLSIVGLGLLVLGARALVTGAVGVARGLGMSELVIGLTIVAVGTSLPELATSLLAAVRREADIAVGNVVGSNIFNILGILGLTALISPIQGFQVGTIDLLALAGTAIALLPMARSGFRVSRSEGVVLLLAYGLYGWWLLRT